MTNSYIIDDDASFSFWLKKLITKHVPETDPVIFHSLSEIIEGGAVREDAIVDPDLIFLDNFIGQDKGFEHTERLRKAFPYATIITMSSMDYLSEAVGSLEKGANQYFTKGEFMEADLVEYLTDRDQTQSVEEGIWRTYE